MSVRRPRSSACSPHHWLCTAFQLPSRLALLAMTRAHADLVSALQERSSEMSRAGGSRDWELPGECVGGEVEHAEAAEERERRRRVHAGEVEAP